MTGLSTKVCLNSSATEYAYGRHQEWECVAHEVEAEHKLKTGDFWSYDFRKRWLERYFTITPYNAAHTVRECGVCSAELADSMFQEDVGIKATQDLKNHLRDLTRRIAGKGTRRTRHIDKV